MGSGGGLLGVWDEYPRCARCAKPVERFVVDHDLLAEEYIMVAACHGETQTIRVTWLEAVGGFGIGEAFADERTPPSVTPLALPEQTEAGNG